MKKFMLSAANASRFLLCIAVLLETLSYTYLKQIDLYYSLSVIHFVSGVAICLLPFGFKPLRESSKKHLILTIPFFCLLAGILFFYIPQQFNHVPLDYHIADMLPRIKIYATRFIQGNYVYDDVKEIWGGGLPPYFPATWLPFLAPVLFDFDVRWIPFVAFIVALLLIILMIKWDKDLVNNFAKVVVMAGLFFLINYNACFNSQLWTITLRGVNRFLLCTALPGNCLLESLYHWCLNRSLSVK